MKEVDVKIMREGAKLPVRGSSNAAGYDLCAELSNNEFMEVEPGTNKKFVRIPDGATRKIGTGLAISPPTGTFGAIFARSGLATKQGLRPANCVGVCDPDYTGEYVVAIHNDSDCCRKIYQGDRIAQLIFIPFVEADFTIVDELNETERSSKGFGSTGLQ